MTLTFVDVFVVGLIVLIVVLGIIVVFFDFEDGVDISEFDDLRLRFRTARILHVAAAPAAAK